MKTAEPDHRRWEYRFLRVTPDDQSAAKLSALGAEGWRVVHVTQADPGALHAVLERSTSAGRPDASDAG